MMCLKMCFFVSKNYDSPKAMRISFFYLNCQFTLNLRYSRSSRAPRLTSAIFKFCATGSQNWIILSRVYPAISSTLRLTESIKNQEFFYSNCLPNRIVF